MQEKKAKLAAKIEAERLAIAKQEAVTARVAQQLEAKRIFAL